MPFAAIVEFLKPLFGKLLDWLPMIGIAIFARESGKASVVATNTKKAIEIVVAQQKASAEAPKTTKALSDELRDPTKEI